MTKAIFINAETREIVSVQLKNQLKETYQLIGCDIVDSALYLQGNDLMVVDGEGYFKSGLSGFFYDGMFFYGNAVIWGCDDEGESDDCQSDVTEVSTHIEWVDEIMADAIRNSQLNYTAKVVYI